jgi:hypothetical protein
MSLFDFDSTLTRRLAVSRIGKAAAVATAAMAGLIKADAAYARGVACCELAYGADCPGAHCGCGGAYEWECYYAANHHFYICGECTCGSCSYALMLSGG